MCNLFISSSLFVATAEIALNKLCPSTIVCKPHKNYKSHSTNQIWWVWSNIKFDWCYDLFIPSVRPFQKNSFIQFLNLGEIKTERTTLLLHGPGPSFHSPTNRFVSRIIFFHLLYSIVQFNIIRFLNHLNIINYFACPY